MFAVHSHTVTMVIMVIIGGKGSLAGPIVGGMIFGLLPVFLRPIMAPEAQWIAYGGRADRHPVRVAATASCRSLTRARIRPVRRKRIETSCPVRSQAATPEHA